MKPTMRQSYNLELGYLVNTNNIIITILIRVQQVVFVRFYKPLRTFLKEKEKGMVFVRQHCLDFVCWLQMFVT